MTSRTPDARPPRAPGFGAEGAVGRPGAPNRELWFVRPGAVELRESPPPRPPAVGEVLARARASGVSRGTELLLFRGEGPEPFDPSLDSTFGAPGRLTAPSAPNPDAPDAPTYPRRYGYAWVGEVVEAGPGAALAPGDRVFALAPHGDVHVLPAGAARRLPPGLPSARAVLAASLETAVTCIWDAGLSLGDEAVILGGGVVGLLVVALAARAGARVRLVEPSPRRRAVARALGAADALAPDADRPRADADVVICATGDPAELDRAIAHAAREATITVASFYGARRAPVALGDAFHRRRLALRATQVSTIPPERAPRWDAARRFALVLSLLDDARLDLLLDPPVPFADAPAAYARLAADAGEGLQTVFHYDRPDAPGAA